MDDDSTPTRRLGALLALACLSAVALAACAPAAGATHCGSNVLLEAVVVCVYQCGSFYPANTPVLSYCITNNGRCPGTIERLPDVYPYVTWCDRTGTAYCNPPPALVRLEVCNQI